MRPVPARAAAFLLISAAAPAAGVELQALALRFVEAESSLMRQGTSAGLEVLPPPTLRAWMSALPEPQRLLPELAYERAAQALLRDQTAVAGMHAQGAPWAILLPAYVDPVPARGVHAVGIRTPAAAEGPAAEIPAPEFRHIQLTEAHFARLQKRMRGGPLNFDSTGKILGLLPGTYAAADAAAPATNPETAVQDLAAQLSVLRLYIGRLEAPYREEAQKRWREVAALQEKLAELEFNRDSPEAWTAAWEQIAALEKSGQTAQALAAIAAYRGRMELSASPLQTALLAQLRSLERRIASVVP
ncbi:MAG: hypothetical protein HY552_00515 [Elusimicrobia bacterium]|nr:hypothetical protein [Elusimicrobiota bacterium]